jgi:hypothetical protein
MCLKCGRRIYKRRVRAKITLFHPSVRDPRWLTLAEASLRYTSPQPPGQGWVAGPSQEPDTTRIPICYRLNLQARPQH